MDNILKLLGDWKERILFVIVVLLALMIVTKAQWVGHGIDDVYSEEYTGSISATGIEPSIGDSAMKQLESPPDVAPEPPNPNEVDKIHFNARSKIVLTGSSGWMLTQDDFESLPPLSLSLPNFTEFADFDSPAGPSPEFSHLRGIVKRDGRAVSLSETSASEFGDE
ncbi:hypothetical protein OAU50_03855 [Planctomycetota bacterium]|nr:hypothetical protein [Planctomycetota bacterium]